MDQGLKERLIGAAVLVALGVWLIPWVLDGKKEQVELDGSDTELRLPTPDEPLPVRSQTLSLDNEPETVAVEPERAAPPAPVAAQRPPAEVEDTKPTPPPVESPVVARADTEPAPAAPSVPKPAEVAPPPKPAASTAAAAAAARTDAKGAWVVQLGSFGEEANAKRLAQRVNTFGYKPEVSNYRASGKTMFRVRVGPYATRAQADATASGLSAHGVKGQVVAAD